MNRQFLKDPDAVLDYSIDWTRWLAGDTISTSEWAVPEGLVKDGDSNSAAVATVWLSGGTVGESYAVTNRITTAGGRTEDRTIVIKVQQR